MLHAFLNIYYYILKELLNFSLFFLFSLIFLYVKVYRKEIIWVYEVVNEARRIYFRVSWLLIESYNDLEMSNLFSEYIYCSFQLFHLSSTTTLFSSSLELYSSIVTINIYIENIYELLQKWTLRPIVFINKTFFVFILLIYFYSLRLLSPYSPSTFILKMICK